MGLGLGLRLGLGLGLGVRVRDQGLVPTMPMNPPYPTIRLSVNPLVRMEGEKGSEFGGLRLRLRFGGLGLGIG